MDDHDPNHSPQATARAPGYHMRTIKKGTYGDLSKIAEELDEALDAEEQGNPVMVLQELSDVLGAIRGYLQKHHPSIMMYDLQTMSDATDRAFLNGSRK